MIRIKAHRRPRLRCRVTTLTCAATLILVPGALASATLSRSARHHAGHIARSLNVTDTAHLHYVRESGSDLLEEGQATGGLPGQVQARFNVGATVYATFTISTRYGSISGKGSGKLRGTGVYASFGGTMTVSSGTGRYSHARGHGGFYGVIDRHTYASTVQTTGTLTY